MIQDRAIKTMLGLCTGILIFAALYFVRSILVPVAFALFIIAIVWPLQRELQARMPRILALAITVLAIFVVVTMFGSLIVWGFGKVGQWLIANSARFQQLYNQMATWLEGHGVFVGSLLVENFNVAWLLRVFQEIATRIQGLISFSVLVLVFTTLGLLEVDLTRNNIERISGGELASVFRKASAATAAKFQKYMLVRTAMSLLTGIVIWGFALIAGLELATAWGVIAFALNYIPFLGPLVATIFPTLIALAQSESWELAVVVFLILNLIQFLIGSYLEPRLAGAALSVSPFLVLFSVFFWAYLWGIPGAFIGVPIAIAALTVCEHCPSAEWLATLLSGRGEASAS